MCSIWDYDYNVNCKHGFDDSYNIIITTTDRSITPQIRNEHAYYPLKHSSNYQIRLGNNTDKRCNVILFIDGKKMGKWRIDAYDSIKLERPSQSSRKFVFVKENSWKGEMGNVRNRAMKNGLIEAKFIPEQNYDRNRWDSFSNSSIDNGVRQNCRKFGIHQSFGENMNDCNYNSSGATILGRNSQQHFNTASRMEEDHNRSVIKRVRLVIDNRIDHHRLPYAPIYTVDNPSPCRNCWKQKQDKIPPRIDNDYF